MPDVFTEKETIGLGSNIGNSIKGILGGIIMIIIAIVILWKNEGRINMGKAAEKMSVPASAEKTDPSLNGKFVSITGIFESEGNIGDPEYIKPGPYTSLSRVVEMYAWVEEKSTKTKKKVGGKTEKITTYKYIKKWTSSPRDSSNFKHPQGHENPSLSIEPKTWKAETGKIGVYNIDLRAIALPASHSLKITEEMLINDYIDGYLENGIIYKGNGSISNPKLGDIKISYNALDKSFNGTIFGKIEGSNIVPYNYKGKKKLYRLFYGSREDAISTMKTEYKFWLWIMRLIGFLLMWGGFQALFGPLFAILDILPFLGSVTRSVVGIATFILALVFSLIIIIVSMIAHSLIALLVVSVLVIGGIFFIFKKKGQKTAAA
jgi:hypothetical protein